MQKTFNIQFTKLHVIKQNLIAVQKKKRMGKVLKSSKSFQILAALIDWVLSFHNLLLVFAGLNAPVKKSSSSHQIDNILVSMLDPFPLSLMFIFEELASVIEIYTTTAKWKIWWGAARYRGPNLNFRPAALREYHFQGIAKWKCQRKKKF